MFEREVNYINVKMILPFAIVFLWENWISLVHDISRISFGLGIIWYPQISIEVWRLLKIKEMAISHDGKRV